MIKGLEEQNIIFGPDQNLGAFIAKQCPEKNIVLWNGFCPTHHKIKKEDVLTIKALHPDALLLVHPECTPDVTELADYAGSTKGIIDYATASDHQKFIIGTEIGVMHQLEKDILPHGTGPRVPEHEENFPEECFKLSGNGRI